MHLFYYLYIVVVVIPFKQIKVMKLKAYLLLQKLEIQLVCPTETSFENVMTSIQGTNGIITGTGITGCTIDGDTQKFFGDGTIGLTALILLLFLGAHLIDRKFNLNQDLDQELQKTQDQNNQENQNHE